LARDELAGLWRTARKLERAARARKPRRGRPALPPLFFFTDPDRTPAPERTAARLPRGAGVVFRAFGRPDAVQVGRRLAALARARGLVLLVGADEALAARLGADGLHLPERSLAAAPRLRARRPGWLLTGAAHSRAALARAARAGLDGAVLSPAFPSRSLSAGRPLGPLRFARLARGARLPVYALGGVSARTARRLESTRAAGLAAVEALSD
jgi:thiamine-phosphate pyrophosphorylase